ncbi:PEGA domain-containing protein [Spirochaeta isovalerica]|uniref:Serine protease n=1 Tax=Spirochaeta isovalerica TaxID=150 RepID=A0A841RAI4_9SPIO|nr:PEGA domain-containing protein [Spirochaeta isovalerica]MBB6480381.1 V8-like Glu-specific endopeptidase [Spirochaeta isovalerica]
MGLSGSAIKKTVLLLFIISLHSVISAADWASVIENSGPSIGRVLIKDSRGSLISQGTGFVIRDLEGNQLFVTNAHVVRHARFDMSDRVEIAFDYGNRNKTEESSLTATIERYNEYLDLALLRMNESIENPLVLDSDGGNGLMSEIVVAGYPLGKNFKATPGMIQAFQTESGLGEMIDMSADLAPGNSGGPVLNSRGEVIGIATAVIQGYNFNYAIPVDILIKFLDYRNNTVNLRINSNPAGSRVFINGEYKGETPVSLDLFNTNYEFRIEKEGYSPLEETVGPWDVEEENVLDRTLEVLVLKDPTIWIYTEPVGAEIFVGNTSIGFSPISVEMPPGRILRIKAQKGRFKKGSANYRVTDDPEQRVDITLD